MDYFENSDFYNSSALDVDEASLNVTTFADGVKVYFLSSDCHECPFAFLRPVLANKSEIIRFSTKHNSVWRFYNDSDSQYRSASDNSSLICEVNENFGQFGIYELVIDDGGCNFQVKKEHVNIYWSLFAVLVGLVLLYIISKWSWNFGKKLTDKKENNFPEEHEMNAEHNVKKKVRLKSVDAFRGLALCLMIFVNDGGGQYWFFNHSTWNGLYPADLLFPWFLWIMGACVTLSSKAFEKSSAKKWTILKNILQRTLLLFIFGLSLNTLGIGPVNVNELRIPGVLQRIAICYGITSAINAVLPKLQIQPSTRLKYIYVSLPQWIFHIGVLCVHYYLTFHLDVPGCPSGYLKAGGIQNDGAFANCTGGAAGYIDKLILGESRLWQNAPLRRVYQTAAFDPENILGCLTSVFQTFLGLQAGLILACEQRPRIRRYHFAAWGAILSVLGLILHFVEAIPLNKNLWSLSFVLVTSGLAFLTFLSFYQLIDVFAVWNGAPFIYPGMNSILVYIGHEMCFQLFPWHWKISRMNTHFINLVENSWGVVVWIAITFVLYQKRTFISV